MSPLPSLYDHPFHRDIICPWSIIYITCLQVLGGCVIQGFFVILSLVDYEQYGYTKNRLDAYWEDRVVEGGRSSHWITLTLEKELELSI